MKYIFLFYIHKSQTFTIGLRNILKCNFCGNTKLFRKTGITYLLFPGNNAVHHMLE